MLFARRSYSLNDLPDPPRLCQALHDEEKRRQQEEGEVVEREAEGQRSSEGHTELVEREAEGQSELVQRETEGQRAELVKRETEGQCSEEDSDSCDDSSDEEITIFPINPARKEEVDDIGETSTLVLHC